MIQLLDGTTRAVSMWRGGEWKPTNLGKKFFEGAVVRYTVSFPVFVDLTRANGTTYRREDWLASTATQGLGEIETKRGASEQEQIQDVRRKTAAFLNGLPEVEHEKVIMAGYETIVLDPAREIQYNRLSVNEAGTVEAVMHRPLGGRPWRFDVEGVSEDAFVDTGGQCVPFQLTRCLRVRGRAEWSQEEVLNRLEGIREELYATDPDSPYLTEEGELTCEEAGVTTAIVVEFCRRLQCPLHIVWNNCKIEAYTPEKSRYETVCYEIRGGHAYFISDQHTKQHLAKETVKEPSPMPPYIVSKMPRRFVEAPAVEWEPFSDIRPGHFWTRELHAVWANMHKEGIIPKVYLSGVGHLKLLVHGGCTVHQWPRDGGVCLCLSDVYAQWSGRGVNYRGESMAGFSSAIFDDMCATGRRQPLTAEEREAVLATTGGLCVHCGEEAEEIDHQIPRLAHGSDESENLSPMCRACHREKTSGDLQRMNVEDSNVFVSRFSQETWEGFVKSRKPRQIVCNLHEQAGSGQVVNVDVRACRLSAIVEANCHPVPIFSPVDEFRPATEGTLADYNWVDKGSSYRSVLGSLPYDGPRWYDRAACEYMLEVGVINWQDIGLAFQASAHRPAEELANRVDRLRRMWAEVGGTLAAHEWAGEGRKGKTPTELLWKTAMVGLIGAWGRTENHVCRLIKSSRSDGGMVTMKPSPCSEETEGGYVYHDICWKQECRSLSSLLCLNRIA